MSLTYKRVMSHKSRRQRERQRAPPQVTTQQVDILNKQKKSQLTLNLLTNHLEDLHKATFEKSPHFFWSSAASTRTFIPSKFSNPSLMVGLHSKFSSELTSETFSRCCCLINTQTCKSATLTLQKRHRKSRGACETAD